MAGQGADWAQLARIVSESARELLDEFTRADAGARLTITVELAIGGDTRVCEVRMASPRAAESKAAENKKAAPGRSESPPGRPDAANSGRSWARLGARDGA